MINSVIKSLKTINSIAYQKVTKFKSISLLTSKDNSSIKTSPFGVTKGTLSNLKKKKKMNHLLILEIKDHHKHLLI